MLPVMISIFDFMDGTYMYIAMAFTLSALSWKTLLFEPDDAGEIGLSAYQVCQQP
jgi:hypothetical protein